MFSLNESNRFFICVQGVDLRKGFDGLCGMLRHSSLSPQNGDVYIFINKSRNTLKLLHWERGGFVIYHKRMESGRISYKIFDKEKSEFQVIRWDQLVLFIEGINPKTRRRKRCNF